MKNGAYKTVEEGIVKAKVRLEELVQMGQITDGFLVRKKYSKKFLEKNVASLERQVRSLLGMLNLLDEIWGSKFKKWNTLHRRVSVT